MSERSGGGFRVLTADGVREAVDELVDELVDRGVPARLTIYGGAAIALVHYERPATSTRRSSHRSRCWLQPASWGFAVAFAAIGSTMRRRSSCHPSQTATTKS